MIDTVCRFEGTLGTCLRSPVASSLSSPWSRPGSSRRAATRAPTAPPPQRRPAQPRLPPPRAGRSTTATGRTPGTRRTCRPSAAHRAGSPRSSWTARSTPRRSCPAARSGRHREQHRLRASTRLQAGVEGAPRHAARRRATGRAATSTRSASPARRSTYAGTTVYVAAEYTRPVRHQLVALDLRDRQPCGSAAALDLAGVRRPGHAAARRADRVAGGRVWVPFGGLAGDCGNYKGRLVGHPGERQRGGGSPTPCRPPARPASGRRRARRRTSRADCYVAVGNGASGVGRPLRPQRLGPVASAPRANCSTRSRRAAGPATTTPTSISARRARPSSARGSSRPASPAPPTCCAARTSAASAVRSARGRCAGRSAAPRSSAAPSTSPAPTACARWASSSTGRMAVPGTRLVHHRLAGGRRRPGVVGGPDSGRLYALDPSTGKVRTSIAVGTTSRFATPALADRDVLVPTPPGWWPSARPDLGGGVARLASPCESSSSVPVRASTPCAWRSPPIRPSPRWCARRATRGPRPSPSSGASRPPIRTRWRARPRGARRPRRRRPGGTARRGGGRRGARRRHRLLRPVRGRRAARGKQGVRQGRDGGGRACPRPLPACV